MAERLLKCPICGQYGRKVDMVRETDKRHYHKEYCHGKFKKDKEATMIENQQWDDLYQYIIKLHDIVVLPKGNITRLKDLRAGFDTKAGKKERKWRSGPDYGLILDAYKLAESSIKWCITNKLKEANDTRAINYGISIMIDKLNEAFARRKAKLRQQEYAEINKNNDTYEIEEITYKPKTSQTNNNIADFL
ncbi:hypothetical protein IAQ67_16050 [Paenibacillus peoriae]|uniref:Uncharacterized protein n=2 Tax=Paenibacillus TaxID=44249 RepID=A0A7H0Y2U8_9BACL|nr:hypothetical protein [Paenibacillus peoriae]QNR65406.1 hypothetical protein IAQ67_16050 [Paenibacillus peoriae]